MWFSRQGNCHRNTMAHGLLWIRCLLWARRLFLWQALTTVLSSILWCSPSEHALHISFSFFSFPSLIMLTKMKLPSVMEQYTKLGAVSIVEMVLIYSIQLTYLCCVCHFCFWYYKMHVKRSCSAFWTIELSSIAWQQLERTSSLKCMWFAIFKYCCCLSRFRICILNYIILAMWEILPVGQQSLHMWTTQNCD